MTIRILSLLLLALLVGCSSSQLPTPQATIASPPVNASPVPTRTPTSIPSETPTLPPSPIPTPESSPIATPVDLEQPALELLRTNNGCKLPCWWGITPGKTTWADAKEFLELFGEILDVRETPDGWLVAEVLSPIDKEYSPIFGGVRLTLGINDGIVEEIDAHEFDEPSWRLDSFLQQYGPPSYAYISTYSRDSGMPANTVPFSVALFYPEKGILATYDGGYGGSTDAHVVGSQIRACLNRGNPLLFLWNPEDRVTFAYASQSNDVVYLPLQQATGMSVNQFYEAYKDGNVEACLETPASLWPDQ